MSIAPPATVVRRSAQMCYGPSSTATFNIKSLSAQRRTPLVQVSGYHDVSKQYCIFDKPIPLFVRMIWGRGFHPDRVS